MSHARLSALFERDDDNKQINAQDDAEFFKRYQQVFKRKEQARKYHEFKQSYIK